MFVLLLFASCNDEKKSAQAKVNRGVTDSVATVQTRTETPALKVDSSSTKTTGSIETIDSAQMNRARVSRKDSTIWLTAQMRSDHRIFGYERPDTNSKKMFLLSIFTSDVKENPYKCPYGAYYETSEMNGLKLKLRSNGDQFAEISVNNDDGMKGVVYIQKDWIEFTD